MSNITEKAPSGALYRLTAYVPASLHTKVKRAAQQADVSIGAWIRQALAESLAELAETEELKQVGATLLRGGTRISTRCLAPERKEKP